MYRYLNDYKVERVAKALRVSFIWSSCDRTPTKLCLQEGKTSWARFEYAMLETFDIDNGTKMVWHAYMDCVE